MSKFKVERRYLLEIIGLTLDELLEDQGHKCAICMNPLTKETAYLDHCHTTELPRQLLCFGCNTGLGLFKEDSAALTRAARYVEQWAESHAKGRRC